MDLLLGALISSAVSLAAVWVAYLLGIRSGRDQTRHDKAVEVLVEVRRLYRRYVWADQPEYLEVSVEKDALSGIFWGALAPYGVTLNVGRG